MIDKNKENNLLPFRCRMACVSLIGGSLVLLLIILIYKLGYIPIEAAVWTSIGVFTLLAIYECYLVSLIAMQMIKGINET